MKLKHQRSKNKYQTYIMQTSSGDANAPAPPLEALRAAWLFISVPGAEADVKSERTTMRLLQLLRRRDRSLGILHERLRRGAIDAADHHQMVLGAKAAFQEDLSELRKRVKAKRRKEAKKAVPGDDDMVGSPIYFMYIYVHMCIYMSYSRFY